MRARAWVRFRRLLGWLLATLLVLLAAALRLALRHGSDSGVRRLVIAAIIAGGAMLAGASALALSFWTARGRDRQDEGENPPPAFRPPDAPG